MTDKYPYEDKTLRSFDTVKTDYQKWYPIFSRLGLNPRRYFRDESAVYVGTVEGWFRLSLSKYSKEELRWLRSILQYLDERSFMNWAVPWQKTIIWEENNYCYLIQPWLFTREHFYPNDPAAIDRIAEILAELYRCGKDYRENRGIEIFRDHWSTVEQQWEAELKNIQSLSDDKFHDKIRKEVHELKKDTIGLVEECLSIWKGSINKLLEHHLQSGVIGHGKLLADYIVWQNNDYYLLNWEHLSFQPKISDLASLINDIGVWEPEWIIYFINEYSRIQPFWPEEYQALKVMLQYPKRVIELLCDKPTEELDYKEIKEVRKELKRKERCLAKVWRESGSDQYWGKNRIIPEKKHEGNGKLSLVLSPVETWGGFSDGQFDSLICVKSEQRLPNDVIERLSNLSEDRVFGGKDGNILEGVANDGFTEVRVENTEVEISEKQSDEIDEKLSYGEETGKELTENEGDKLIQGSAFNPTVNIPETGNGLSQQPKVLNWSKFPETFRK